MSYLRRGLSQYDTSTDSGIDTSGLPLAQNVLALPSGTMAAGYNNLPLSGAVGSDLISIAPYLATPTTSPGSTANPPWGVLAAVLGGIVLFTFLIPSGRRR